MCIGYLSSGKEVIHQFQLNHFMPTYCCSKWKRNSSCRCLIEYQRQPLIFLCFSSVVSDRKKKRNQQYSIGNDGFESMTLLQLKMKVRHALKWVHFFLPFRTRQLIRCLYLLNMVLNVFRLRSIWLAKRSIALLCTCYWLWNEWIFFWHASRFAWRQLATTANCRVTLYNADNKKYRHW